MLLYAVLSCGACHLSLVNKYYAHSTSQDLYDKAVSTLFRQLQDPSRDIYLCAITALVLNAFELMTEEALQKMNHIAGARALVKECGWDANSSGMAVGCFWFSIATEILNCAVYNWTTGWNPNEWGFRLEKTRSDVKPMENTRTADEWIYAILHILARIINHSLMQSLVHEEWDADAGTSWESLEHLCSWWWRSIPHELRPLMNSEKSATSSFPYIK